MPSRHSQSKACLSDMQRRLRRATPPQPPRPKSNPPGRRPRRQTPASPPPCAVERHVHVPPPTPPKGRSQNPVERLEGRFTLGCSVRPTTLQLKAEGAWNRRRPSSPGAGATPAAGDGGCSAIGDCAGGGRSVNGCQRRAGEVRPRLLLLLSLLPRRLLLLLLRRRRLLQRLLEVLVPYVVLRQCGTREGGLAGASREAQGGGGGAGRRAAQRGTMADKCSHQTCGGAAVQCEKRRPPQCGRRR